MLNKTCPNCKTSVRFADILKSMVSSSYYKCENCGAKYTLPIKLLLLNGFLSFMLPLYSIDGKLADSIYIVALIHCWWILSSFIILLIFYLKEFK